MWCELRNAEGGGQNAPWLKSAPTPLFRRICVSSCTPFFGLAAFRPYSYACKITGKAKGVGVALSLCEECICIWKSLVRIYSISWEQNWNSVVVHVRFQDAFPLFHIARLCTPTGALLFFFTFYDRQEPVRPSLIRTKLKNKIDRKISEFLSKGVYEWLSEVIWLPLLFPQRWHGYVCMCFNIYIRDVSYIYILIFLHLKWIWVSRVTHMSRHVDRWCEYVSSTRPKRVLKSWM